MQLKKVELKTVIMLCQLIQNRHINLSE